jgi:hypothetical protein
MPSTKCLKEKLRIVELAGQNRQTLNVVGPNQIKYNIHCASFITWFYKSINFGWLILLTGVNSGLGHRMPWRTL